MKWFLVIYNTIVYFVLFPLMFNDAAVLTIMQVQCVCVFTYLYVHVRKCKSSGTVLAVTTTS